jgi:hypothetical protein
MFGRYLTIDEAVMDEVKLYYDDVSVAWIDYTKTYDRVPLWLI